MKPTDTFNVLLRRVRRVVAGALSILPILSSEPIVELARVARQKRRLKGLGKGVQIQVGAMIRRPDLVEIGTGSTINIDFRLLGAGGCTIGTDTMIGPGVMILTTQHDSRATVMKGTGVHAPVSIGNNTWIGGGAIILPGVSVGNDCIVGAGAVVTRDVTDGQVVVGVPARAIRSRDAADTNDAH